MATATATAAASAASAVPSAAHANRSPHLSRCLLFRQSSPSPITPSPFLLSLLQPKPARRIEPFCCLPSTNVPLVTPLVDLFDFICAGPLLSKAGFDSDSVKNSIDEWLELGLRLSRQLGFNELLLTPSEKIRIYHYYIPVYMWCKQQLEQHQSQFKEGDQASPLVIGITAPQGCGKSTLVYSLDYLFNATGSRAISVSIDDFYLTGAEQEALAAKHPGNLLLELRGNAGSHDLKLGTDTLESLRNCSSPGRKVTVPRYDKSARNGRGDRADQSAWPIVEGPLKVVLFEGWMLGFEPVDSVTYESVDPQLDVVNKNLAAYHDAWDKHIDSWIIIKVKNLDAIYQWRLQAEIGMRSTGRAGMTDEEVKDFVSRYMPAYKTYLPGLYSTGPKGAVLERTFQFDIDDGRNPIG